MNTLIQHENDNMADKKQSHAKTLRAKIESALQKIGRVLNTKDLSNYK
ncbi:hypothetical protein L0668_07565 [Paraglaciecola aquimarina]|uniref:Uncharacterized protein n=1 Tax=Paraglaciecola algarum TaxID=3050085 RepID=A0ABS9D5K3_9ALTE|nr:hypothetical protein [Paraglaciecola sp. G1-23]MCF2947959.1 hypothetical protein [Paraglaciecola sp. G1-23]